MKPLIFSLAVYLPLFFTAVLTKHSARILQGYVSPIIGIPFDGEDYIGLPSETPGTTTANNIEVVQQISQGFATQINMTAPDSVLDCLDEPSAILIARFYYSIVHKLSLGDFMTVPDRVREFQANIAPPIAECISNNAEIKTMLQTYGVDQVSLGVLYSLFATYALTGHEQDLINDAADVRGFYEGGKFEKAGTYSGEILQTVLAYKPEILLSFTKNPEYSLPVSSFKGIFSTAGFLLKLAEDTDNEESEGDTDNSDQNEYDESTFDRLRNLIIGFFREADIGEEKAHSLTARCLNKHTAKSTLDTIGKVLSEFSERNYFMIPGIIDNYEKNLPGQTRLCLEISPESQRAKKAYHIEGRGLNYLYGKASAYNAAKGSDSLLGWVEKIKDEMDSGSSESAGEYIGKFIKAIVG